MASVTITSPTTTTPIDMCSQITFTKLSGLLNFASCTLINYVVPLLFTVAVVAFIWGVIQMVINPANEEARKKGKSFMIWGLVGLFVMVSVWGIVSVFTHTFNIGVFVPQLSQT